MVGADQKYSLSTCAIAVVEFCFCSKASSGFGQARARGANDCVTGAVALVLTSGSRSLIANENACEYSRWHPEVGTLATNSSSHLARRDSR